MSDKIIVKKQESNVLVHHGIRGQRWGVRRYQNADGSLTAAGKRRQSDQEAKKEFSEAKKKYRLATAESRRERGKKFAIASGAVVGAAGLAAAAVAGRKFINARLLEAAYSRLP